MPTVVKLGCSSENRITLICNYEMSRLAATVDAPGTGRMCALPKTIDAPLQFTEVVGRMLALRSASIQYFSGRPVALPGETHGMDK